MVILNCFALPEQLLEKGMTCIRALIAWLAGLIAVNDCMVPVPLAGIPIPTLLFVH